jgi:hypothetical protein
VNKLVHKAIIIIAITLVCAILLLSMSSHTILSGRFSKLEKDEAFEGLHSAVNTLLREATLMESGVADWAHWDDTYTFVQDGNQDYIDLNLTAPTFAGVDLALMLFTDVTGTPTFARAYNLESETDVTAPIADYQALIAQYPALTDHQTEDSSAAGIILTATGPMLVASRPVLTSLGEGPIAGVLIWGRHLDDTLVETLGGTIQISVTATSIADAAVWPQDFQNAYAAITSEGRDTYFTVLDSDNAAAYQLIYDLNGDPALLVRVDIDRAIFQQGQTSIAHVILSLLVISAVYGIVTLIALNKLVIARVSNLTDSVRRITQARAFSDTITVDGTDELSTLATSVNDMLAALAESQRMLQQLNAELEARVAERTSSLQQTKEHVEAILNNVSDTIMLLGSDGIIRNVNPAFYTLFGRHPNEAIGQPLASLIDASNTDLLCDTLRQVFSSRRPERIEIVAHRSDGTRFDAEMGLALIYNPNQPAPLIVCSMRDITERKMYEQNLRHALENEHELNELKTRFVSMASHEFRTPLTIIQSSSDLINRYIDRMEPSQRTAHFNKISAQIQHITTLLDDVLNLGHLEAEAARAQLEFLDLDRFVNDIIRETQHSLPVRQEIMYVHEGAGSYVAVDQKLMRAIVENLIGNAAKYSEDDSLIEVQLAVREDEIIFRVSDEGIGISNEDQARLFAPFFRATNVGTIKGTGLGLAITKRSVDILDGEIEVESAIGAGTTFTITIPRILESQQVL